MGIKLVAAMSAIMAAGVFAFPVPAGTQPPPRVYHIGYLGRASPPDLTPQGCPVQGNREWQALREGLREHGYVQGQNLVIECRYTEDQDDRAPALAAELVGMRLDLLVVFSTANVRAAKQATSTIPIVMVGVLDPVGRGLVASLAQPGGNVTGTADHAGRGVAGTYLQLIKEAFPQASRVAVLLHAADPPESIWGAELDAAARALRVTLLTYEVREAEAFDGAFTAMSKARADALVVMPSPFMWIHAQRVVDLAARNRLPAIYPGRDFVDAGGLMAYLVDQTVTRRRLGYYIDAIFKGAKPSDLPVEQPTGFELVINLRAAREQGFAIPQSLLLRANDIIQ